MLDIDRVVMAKLIQFGGRNPSRDKLRDIIQLLRGEAPGNAHFLDFFRGLDGDAHIVATTSFKFSKDRGLTRIVQIDGSIHLMFNIIYIIRSG